MTYDMEILVDIIIPYVTILNAYWRCTKQFHTGHSTDRIGSATRTEIVYVWVNMKLNASDFGGNIKISSEWHEYKYKTAHSFMKCISEIVSDFLCVHLPGDTS